MNDNDSGVYVIMTSNDVSQLPPELTRAGRLDAIWYFGLPTPDDRREIFKIHFKHHNRTVSDRMLSVAVNSSDHFTGAEIEQAVKNALRKAFKRYKEDHNENLTLADIEAGCHDVVPVYNSSREKILALENWCKGRALNTNEKVGNKESSEEEDFRHSLEL